MRRTTLAVIAAAVGITGLIGFKSPLGATRPVEVVATGPLDPVAEGPAGPEPPVTSAPGPTVTAPSSPEDDAAPPPESPSAEPAPPPAAEPAPPPAEPDPPPAEPVTRTLTGTREQAADFGYVQVQITMTDAQLTDITMLEETSRPNRAARDAPATLIQEALAAQSADIANVSQATYTTDAFKASLQAALDQA